MIDVCLGSTRARAARPIDRHSGLEPGPALASRKRRQTEILGEIAPGWVGLVDQIVLPGARPAFHAFFAQNRGVHRVVGFEPDQPLDAVQVGEPSDQAFVVLIDARQQVGRYARVQRTVGRLCEDVDAGPSVHPRRLGKASPGSRPG